MLLRLFKGTTPGVIFLVIITLIVIWIGALFNPNAPGDFAYETSPMPLYGLLKDILGNTPFIGVIFSISIVSLVAFLIVNFNTKIFFINTRTFLPALIYILLGGLFPLYQVINPVLPASVFLMLALNRIMDAYRKPGTAYNFFDAGILISTGSLFYANLIWFGLLVIIGISILRTGNLLEIAISIVGLLTPYLLAFGLYYVIGKDLKDLLSLIDVNVFRQSAGYTFQKLTIVTLSFTGILIFVSIVYLLMHVNTKKIKSRKTFFLLLWGFIISTGVYIFLPSVSVEIVWLITIPVCYLLAHYFISARKKLVPEILFTILFSLMLALQIWYHV
jgi:hypothetical protein